MALTPWLSDEGLLAFEKVQQRSGPAVLKVLSPFEFSTLQTLVEAILPADERSPGAREARVAEYVDLLLSESEEPVREDGSSVFARWKRPPGRASARASPRWRRRRRRRFSRSGAPARSLPRHLSKPSSSRPRTPPSTATTPRRSASTGSFATRAILHPRVRGLPRRERPGLPSLRPEGLGLKMAADPTLALDLVAIQDESKRLAASIKPGGKRHDVIVVGSGAAGGMAAYLLTPPASTCSCSRRGACSTRARSTGRWSGPTPPCAGSGCPPGSVRSRWRSTPSSIVPTAPSRASPSTRSSGPTPPTPSPATGWWTRRSTPPPAPPTPGCAPRCSGARPSSGAAAPCVTGRCSSGPRAGTASTWTGRSPTRTSPRTTTGWTASSAARGPRRAWSRCPTASSNARPGSTASRPISAGPSPGSAGTSSPAGPGSRPKASSTSTACVLGRGRCGRGCESGRPSTRRPLSSIPPGTPAASRSGRTPGSPRSRPTRRSRQARGCG